MLVGGVWLIRAWWACIFVCGIYWFVFFFKQKTAYEMRISDWSSDVCSSDLIGDRLHFQNMQAAEIGDLFESESGVVDQPGRRGVRHERLRHDILRAKKGPPVLGRPTLTIGDRTSVV